MKCKCNDCKRTTTTRLYERTDEPQRVYRIIRFRQNGRPRTIKSGLTLEEAQAHCRDPKTHGFQWFDGYDYIKGVKP